MRHRARCPRSACRPAPIAWTFAITLAAPLVAGCVPAREPGDPIHVGLHPYAGPASGDRGDLVVGYHPWNRGPIPGGSGRGGTTFAKAIDDAIVRCRNVECRYSAKAGQLTVPSPPASLASIEVTIQRDGYDPIELRIPVSPDPHEQNVLVVLTPASAR